MRMVIFLVGLMPIQSVFISFFDIKPNEEKMAVLTLRFAGLEADSQSLCRDFMLQYGVVNALDLVWNKRRPIGKLFLASYLRNTPLHPGNVNRWFMNDKTLDVRTDTGKERFRERILRDRGLKVRYTGFP